MYYIFNVKSRKCKAYSDSELNSDILREQGEVQIKDDVVYSADEVLRLELQDGKIVLQPAAEPTKDEKLAALDDVYQPQFTALAQGAGLATLDGNEATLANIKEDYVVLKTEYKEKLEAINNG